VVLNKADGGGHRILFSVIHPGYLRNFDSTIRMLAERGHHVRLLFTHHRKAEESGRILLDEYLTRYRIEHEIRSFAPTFWTAWATWIRGIRDYAQYFRPEFQHATSLRDRAGTSLRGSAGKPLPARSRRLVACSNSGRKYCA